MANFANYSEAAQTAIVMINVEITVTDGTSYNDTYVRNGSVNVPDLGCVWHYLYDAKRYLCNQNLDDTGGQSTTQILMHNFGESGFDTLSPALDCGSYDNAEDILNTSHSAIDYRYYCRRTPGQQEFAFRFKEYNMNDSPGIYPYFTNRYISASSGPCYIYDKISPPKAQLQNDGTAVVWNWTISNDTYTGTIAYPTQLDALCGTTYIYRGADVPQRDPTQRCDDSDRCMWIWAHKTRCPGTSDPNPAFYQCPISISSVVNATIPEHNISDSMARLAASGIALNGRKQYQPVAWASYQLYPIG